MNGRVRYAAMKSILEVPAFNEKYVAKIPRSAADAVMLDLEDSVPPGEKARARQRVVQVLQDRAFFGGRTIIVRVNNLHTPWGAADIDSLASAGDGIVICYPKVESADEMGGVVARATAKGHDIGLYPMVETAKAMHGLADILGCDGLVGVHFGYTDLASEMGCGLYNEDGDDLHVSLAYPRTAIAIGAAANGLFSTGGSKVPDYKDLQKVEQFVRRWADHGYTSCIALAPSHVDIVNRVLRPTEREVADAAAACRAFETALAQGEGRAVVGDRVITTPDYQRAKQIVTRTLAQA